MISKIRNIIKKAIITLILDDTSNIQKAQVKYYNKVRNVEIIGSYGLYSIAPVGSQVVLFQVNGQEENLVGIADDVKNRIKDLKEGEVALYNTKTKSLIKLSENGDIEIVGKNDFIKTIEGNENTNITGNKTETILGDDITNITGTKTETILVNKAINITGNKTETILTNDILNITGTQTITILGVYNITVTGAANITAPTVNINAATTNLGIGGNAIARVGDSVVVSDPISGPLSGTITTGGGNTSI